MNVFIYDLPVDLSYRTGWMRYPDTEPVFYVRDLDNRPLEREMTFDIVLPLTLQGYTFCVLETPGDIRGFFIVDQKTVSNEKSTLYGKGSVMVRLFLKQDVWFTCSILRNVRWCGQTCRLPNQDIASGLSYIGSAFPNRWSGVNHLDETTVNIMRKTCIITTFTAKSSLGSRYYYTVLSPPFWSYTEFQQWYNVILRADSIAYKLGFEDGYVDGDLVDPPIAWKEFAYLSIDTIESMALMPYPDGLEINRDIDFVRWNGNSVVYRYHDIPCTVGNSEQITQSTPTGWTILGNLLGDEGEFLPAKTFWVVPSPRSWRKIWSVGKKDGPVYQMIIGNNSLSVEQPAGLFADLVVDLTLNGGVNPFKLCVTINGDPLDLTPSLNIPFFVSASRDQDEKNLRRWATSLTANVIDGASKIITKDYAGAVSTGLSIIGSSRPSRSLSNVTGDASSACVWHVNGENIFIGCFSVGFKNRSLDASTAVLQNVCGDCYAGNVAFNFWRYAPPSNYQTTGIFQIDNPKPYHVTEEFVVQQGFIAECCDIVNRGIILIDPDNIPSTN